MTEDAASGRRLPPVAWIAAPDTVRLFSAFQSAGVSARFVGGCVRDALLGREASDLDMATDAEPDRVIEILKAAGIRAVPTGIEHGTVTALPAHRPFQVTTLRRDVETDGRRAVVAFTRDWAEDAARRDFTINAFSADRHGSVFDYVGGLADLDGGRVRFIGDAGERIREDYLRILRFFRFQATYGKTQPDPEAVAACRAAAAGIAGLSGERLWQEFARILEVPDPFPIVSLMADTSVLAELVPGEPQLPALRALVALEAGRRPDAVRRLAALTDPQPGRTDAISGRFRLSRAESRELSALLDGSRITRPGMDDPSLRRALYETGGTAFGEIVLVEAARASAKGERDPEGWARLLAAAEDWADPVLPVGGSDVVALGVAEGPDIGALLRAVEDWWIAERFRPDREACLEFLRQLAGRRSR